MADRKKRSAADYDAQDITVLEGLEAVRKRPGMYIGSTGERGLHHLVYEVVDNSVDEALAGFCTTIDVTIHADNSVTVADNGRGIPVDDACEKEERPAVEVVLTVLHAGGKFGEGAATRSPAACTASACRWSTRCPSGSTSRSAATATSGRRSTRAGRRMAPLAQGRALDRASTGHHDHVPARRRIFETLDFDFDTLEERLRETAFLNARPADHASSTSAARATARRRSTTRAGSRTSSRYLNENKEPVAPQGHLLRRRDARRARVEVAMQWNASYQESIHSFANNINTHEGGTHLTGFRAALTRTLNKYAREHGLLKEKDDNLTGEDVREGLTAVDLGQAARPAVRGPDQDQARQHRGMAGFVESIVNDRPRRVPRGEPERGRAAIIDKAVAGGAGARGGPQGARPDPAQVARSRTRRCPASSPTARSRTRRWPSSSWSRATPPAARPSRAATATPRRSCRCAARSSTSRSRRIDKVLKNNEIQALITALGTGIARRVRHRASSATTRSS